MPTSTETIVSTALSSLGYTSVNGLIANWDVAANTMIFHFDSAINPQVDLSAYIPPSQLEITQVVEFVLNQMGFLNISGLSSSWDTSNNVLDISFNSAYLNAYSTNIGTSTMHLDLDNYGNVSSFLGQYNSVAYGLIQVTSLSTAEQALTQQTFLTIDALESLTISTTTNDIALIALGALGYSSSSGLTTSWNASTQTSTLSMSSVYSNNSTYVGWISNVSVVVSTNSAGAITSYSSTGTTTSGYPFAFNQYDLDESEVFVIEATNYALNKIDAITSNNDFTNADVVIVFDNLGNISDFVSSMTHSGVGVISSTESDLSSTEQTVIEGAYIEIQALYNLGVADEFQVNTTDYHSQRSSDIATLNDGSVVIVWESKHQDGDSYGVYVQHFDASGNRSGSEIQVNTQTDGTQAKASISALSDGGYVVAWLSGVWDDDADTWALDQGQDGSSAGIYTQRFDSDDNPVGIETQVNTYTQGEQGGASVAGLSGGGYIVSWESYAQDGDNYGVYAQQFDANGGLVNVEFLANTFTASYQSRSDVTALNDGGYVITWRSHSQDGDASGIFAQRYDANGSKVNNEFSVSTEIYSTQSNPSIAALDNGGFVVAWTSKYQDGSYYGIYAQRYDVNGNTTGNEFQVNTYTTNDQYNPSIAALIDGGFIITTRSYAQDGECWGVYEQRIDVNG
jgi:hypothetical protein